MAERNSIICLLAAALAVLSCTGGDDDSGRDAGAGKDAATTDGSVADGSVDGGPAADGGFVERTCGNGEVEELEQCDDGNNNNWDGCTTLCEYSCMEDADCDDLNPCNGDETCTKKHACVLGEELEDGTECGPMRSCWKGLCVDDVCGDGTVTSGEVCDDGNLDPADGCTPDCEYTCESDRDCAGGDECAGTARCDTARHLCSGKPLDDRTPCDDGDGWCMSGECVPFNCGNGKVEGKEQCDEGKNNGKAGFDCSIRCTITKCGNGTIEGNEECDDGNDGTLDGCTPQCRYEFVHRMTKIYVVKEETIPVPDFCIYQGNRFGEAFPGKVEVMPGMEIDVLIYVNQFINSSVDEGVTNALIQIMDSDDISLRTRDDDITVAFYDAIRAKAWEPGPPVDFPFWVERDGLDENLEPKAAIPGEQGGGGRIVTTKPVYVVTQGPTGAFEMYDMMTRVVFDTNTLSTPEPKPEVADQVRVPETHGENDPDADPYYPRGLFCGAMTRASQEAQAVDDRIIEACCRKDGGKYRPCPGGEPSPDCDTFSDVIENGCYICFDPFNPTGGSCSPGCGFPVIEAIDPDVDADGDGKKDSYSTVIAFEGRRVRVRGVTEE